MWFRFEPLPGTYSITVTAVPSEGGTASASKRTAAAGETVTVSWTENSGYRCSGWEILTSNGAEQIDSGSFTMGEGPVSIEVYFEKVYPISFSVSPAGWGTVSVDKNPAAQGETVNVTFTPAEGCELYNWYPSGSSDVMDNSFVMGDGPVTVVAQFINTSGDYYYIYTDVDPEDGGDVNVYPSTTAYPGTPISVTYSADEHFDFDHWTMDGVDYSSSTLSFTMGNDDVDITAHLVAKKYHVSVSCNIDGAATWSLSPSAEGGMYEYGTEVDFSASANEGYHIDSITLNSGPLDDESFEVLGTTNIVINCSKISYGITYATSGGPDGVTVNGPENAQMGDTVSFSVTGYDSSQYTYTASVYGETVSGDSFTMQAQNTTVTVTFTRQYTVTLNGSTYTTGPTGTEVKIEYKYRSSGGISVTVSGASESVQHSLPDDDGFITATITFTIDNSDVTVTIHDTT